MNNADNQTLEQRNILAYCHIVSELSKIRPTRSIATVSEKNYSLHRSRKVLWIEIENEQYPIKKFISQLIDVSVWEALERRHEMILPIHTESSLNLLRYRLFQYIYINLLSILIIDDRIYRVPTTILFPIYRGQCVRYQSLSVALKSNSMEQINHSCV